MKTLLLFLLISVLCVSAASPEIPVIAGSWWKICDTRPDISPYTYTHHNNSVCDFTMFQDTEQVWHLMACVRLNTYPGSHRFLYEWTSAALRDTTHLMNGRYHTTTWQENGIFWTTGIQDSMDVLGRRLEDTPYTAQGKLQAPHCVFLNDQYYLFHNNAGAFCLKSPDGRNWQYAADERGRHKFFDMGRDMMLLDDRAGFGKWIAYYTDASVEPQCVSARTAPSLAGPWSQHKQVCVYDGVSDIPEPIYPFEFAESPFVVKRQSGYYLFAQLQVFYSQDPFSFEHKVVNLEDGVWQHRCWAPEIITDSQGQQHIAAYRVDGIWMARLEWQ
ncbi:MAG: hypothetical protein U5R06_02480 [candidate division KSB1 bacterium]|nr:hypothetical protein [candidate division KSB1 bacterium]